MTTLTTLTRKTKIPIEVAMDYGRKMERYGDFKKCLGGELVGLEMIIFDPEQADLCFCC